MRNEGPDIHLKPHSILNHWFAIMHLWVDEKIFFKIVIKTHRESKLLFSLIMT